MKKINFLVLAVLSASVISSACAENHETESKPKHKKNIINTKKLSDKKK